MTRTPLADAHAEALALLAAAGERDVTVRAVGGLAIRIACPSASRPPLQRPYKDIDLVGLSRERPAIESLLADHGYQADVEFNLLSANGQLYFRDLANARQLDVFLDRMHMCHTLELADRLALCALTLTPVDLLLSKLQVLHTNERDLKDAAALMLDCELDEDYLAAKLAHDWGWWRTVTEVLERLRAYLATLEMAERPRIERSVEELLERIAREPKGRRWKLRARVGERARWYDIPEEDHAEA